MLEDFILREKITHFDHECIPERIVHARGSAAHGYFQLTRSLHKVTTARLLTETGVRTPVFTPFSMHRARCRSRPGCATSRTRALARPRGVWAGCTP